MESWVESIARNANVVAIFAGVLGAVAAHLVATHFRLNNGFRLIATCAGFSALFIGGRSALGQRSDTLTVESSVDGGKGWLRNRVSALIDRLQDELTFSAVRDEAANLADSFTTPALWQYAGVASDTTAHEIARLFEASLRELQSDSTACVRFLLGVLEGHLPPQLSSGLERRFFKLANQVAKEGRESPQPPVDERSATEIAIEMRFWMWRTYGDRGDEMIRLLSNPANAVSKPRQVCTAAIASYEMIADMPRKRGGRLMRYMLYRSTPPPSLIDRLMPLAERRRNKASS